MFFLQDINLPVFFSLFLGYKLWYKTKMVSIIHGAVSSRRWTLVDTFDSTQAPIADLDFVSVRGRTFYSFSY